MGAAYKLCFLHKDNLKVGKKCMHSHFCANAQLYFKRPEQEATACILGKRKAKGSQGVLRHSVIILFTGHFVSLWRYEIPAIKNIDLAIIYFLHDCLNRMTEGWKIKDFHYSECLLTIFSVMHRLNIGMGGGRNHYIYYRSRWRN